MTFIPRSQQHLLKTITDHWQGLLMTQGASPPGAGHQLHQSPLSQKCHIDLWHGVPKTRTAICKDEQASTGTDDNTAYVQRQNI